MTQADAFLKAIVEHPEDDTPRLVCADWLEEHGDPARAEFIRVQCEIARGQAGDPRLGALRTREGKLFNEHKTEWRKDVQTWARSSVRFARGFIDRVTVRASEFGRWGALLLRRAPIQELRIDRVTDDVLARAAEMPEMARLRRLELDVGDFTATGLRALAASPHLRCLAELKLFLHPVAGEVGEVIAAAAHLDGLHTLIVCGGQPGDAGAATLARCRAPANLTTLVIWNSAGGDAVAQALANSPCLASLAELGLLTGQIGPAGALALAGSARLRGLSRLHLGNNQTLGDAGAAALVENPHYRDLVELNLVGCELGPAGAGALAAAPHLGRLNLLYLSHNSIGDEGARALAASPHLANLTKLELKGAGIGEEGWEALAASPHLTGAEIATDFSGIDKEASARLTELFAARKRGRVAP
jgi:uncharacterized protein (TIGR02996 family)